MSDDRATELSEEIDRAITDRLYGGVFTGLPQGCQIEAQQHDPHV